MTSRGELFSRTPPAPDLRIAYGPDALQFGELRLPRGAGPYPLLIAVHGGYWRARYDHVYLGFACEALREAGIATWNIEYRRIGNDGGGWPGTFTDVGHAADAVQEFAAEYTLDLERVAAIGHSAGGHLALWLAGRARIPVDSPLHVDDPLPLRGAVSLAGVCDLREAWALRLSDAIVRDLMGGIPEDVPDRYAAGSPPELLPFGVPQVIMHGVQDDSVPLGISERYAARANAAGDQAELVVLEGADHFDVVDPESWAWESVMDGVWQVLGKV
jgi:acetyl esterase/lipase